MTAKITRLSIIVVIVLAGCSNAATPTPAPESEELKLKLGWLHSVQFLGYYIAQARGHYTDEGLTIAIEPLTDVSEISAVPAQIVAREYDFSMGSQLYITDSQLGGASIVPFAAIVQLSPTTFFAQSDSGIVTPADFAERRIVVKNEEWQQLLEILLAQGGLTLDDIEPVAGGFDITPFYEGEVEVWSGYLNDEVVSARQQGLELVTFPLYEYGIEDIGEALFTSQALIESQPDVAERFLRASIRGWEWAVENPDEAVDIMLELFPELADEREFHLASFNAYIPLVRPPGMQIGTIDCERWLSDPRFEVLDSTENLCTVEIFEAATR